MIVGPATQVQRSPEPRPQASPQGNRKLPSRRSQSKYFASTGTKQTDGMRQTWLHNSANFCQARPKICRAMPLKAKYLSARAQTASVQSPVENWRGTAASKVVLQTGWPMRLVQPTTL